MAKTTGNVNPRAASGYMNPNAAGNKKAASKTAAPKKVKVSQETINLIKKMGMTKALKEVQAYGRQSRMVPGNKEYETMRQGGRELLSGEFATGVKRMYGERRFTTATSPKPKKASTAYSPAPYKKPKPKSGGGSGSKVK
jgi:hypothetical protein